MTASTAGSNTAVGERPGPYGGVARAWQSSTWRRRAGQLRYQFAAAGAIYLLTAIVATWPLVLHIGSGLYLSPDRPYGDYTGTIATLHSLVAGPYNPFLPGHLHNIDAPEGLRITWVLNIASFPEVITLYILALVFGAPAAFDLYVLLAYLGSGLAMFGLIRSLTGRFAVAALFGWAFAFYPFALATGEHPDYMHGWPLVLMVWAGLRAVERPTWRRGLLAGAAAVLAFAWTPYYLLIGGVAYGCEVAAALAIGLFERRLKAQTLAFGVASCVVGAYLVLIVGLSHVAPGATAQPSNSIYDVIAQSARPLNYVLAPSWNSLLGRLTGHEVASRGWGGAEKTLYVGLSLVFLALVAALALVRRKLSRTHRHAVIVAGTIGVVAALCSGPPQVSVGGHLVNMPSWYLFHITSGFRIYSRFVIVIELALCVLAGIGLVALLPAAKPRLRAAIVAVAAVVVVLDLWAPVPYHFERLKVPHLYAILAKQPPGIYADYPLGPANIRPDYHDLYLQEYAGDHPTVNGYQTGTVEAERDEGLADLSAPGVGGRLRDLGVRYVLLERHPIEPFVAASPPTHGFVELASESYGTLYRNDNPPAPTVEALAGFSVPEGDPAEPFRWITAPVARLRVTAICSTCKGVLGFGVASFARPRIVTVTDNANGRVLYRGRVGTFSEVSIPLTFNHTTVLRITASPGPQSVHATNGSPDTRSVSVNLQAPRLELVHPYKTVGIW